MVAGQNKNAWRMVIGLCVFILLFPLLTFPEFALKGILYPDSPIIFPNYELIHLFPRLVLLALVVLLGWRYWSIRSLFAVLMLGHLALVIISVFNSHDPDGLIYSLLGPQRRLDGLVYQAFLVGLSLSSYTLLRQHRRFVVPLVWTLLVAASLQAVVVLLQRFGLDPVGLFLTGAPYTVMRGTLSHPGFVAGLLLPVILIGYGAYAELAKERPYLFWILLFLAALGLGATGNRTSFYALVTVLLLGLVLQRRWPALLSGGLLLVAVLIGNALPYPSPPINEVVSESRSYANTHTLENRLAIWRLGFKALKTIPAAPFLGGGPDAFRLALLQDVPMEDILPVMSREHRWPDNAKVESVTVVDDLGPNLRDVHYDVHFSVFGDETGVVKAVPSTLDKVHSYLYDRLLSYGMFDVMIWLMVFAYPVIRLWPREGGLERGLMLAFLSLGIYYLAWFPVLQVEPLHMIMVAAAWALATQDSAHV